MGLLKKIRSIKEKRYKEKEDRADKKFNERKKELAIRYKNEKQKSDFKTLLSRLKFETYTKRLVAIVVFVGLFDLQLSYILAFLGKDQIAESLSTQICITLLGTVLAYVVRAHFDTKEEKRIELLKSGLILDKDTKIISDKIIKNKVKEVMNNSETRQHTNNKNNTLIKPENPDDE